MMHRITCVRTTIDIDDDLLAFCQRARKEPTGRVIFCTAMRACASRRVAAAPPSKCRRSVRSRVLACQCIPFRSNSLRSWPHSRTQSDYRCPSSGARREEQSLPGHLRQVNSACGRCVAPSCDTASYRHRASVSPCRSAVRRPRPRAPWRGTKSPTASGSRHSRPRRSPTAPQRSGRAGRAGCR